MTLVVEGPNPKKRSAKWWTAVSLLAIGTVLSGVAGWFATYRVLDPIYAASYATPGTVNLDLTPGEHVIWIHAFSISDLFGDDAIPVDPDVDFQRIAVQGPDGESLRLREVPSAGLSPLSRGGSTYLPVAEFRVVSSGRHTILFDDPEADRALISTSWSEGFSRGLPWLIATGIGIIMFAIGFIMWLIIVIRRSRERRTSSIGSSGPPDTQPPSTVGSMPPPPPTPSPPSPAQERPGGHNGMPTPW